MKRRDIQYVDKLVNMEVNNEIRRLRIKLKLFEEEGFNWVIADVIKDVHEYHLSEINPMYIKGLKQRYSRQLKKLIPSDNKQGKLEI